MNRVLYLWLLFVLFFSCRVSERIININDILADSCGIYTIRTPLDLNNASLDISTGCTLNFEDLGTITNGTICGNNTKITGNKKVSIFDKVILKGTWMVPEISTKMFKHVDVNTLSNLSVLSSSVIENSVFIEDKCVAPILDFSSAFIVKSNTNVYLYADIQALPTNYKGGYVIFVRGKNVNIYGNGHRLIGTIRKSTKNKEQWQHGLCINSDASNVYVEKIICNEFWGDGIYSRGSNVTLSNVTCLYNGRQGLSITYGENIIVKNSVFRFTGKYGLNNSNGPGAGIDIEPNSKDYVRHIIVENCVLTDNSSKTFGDVNDLEVFRAPNSSIRFVKCKIGGIYLGTSSDIVFDSCVIAKPIYGINEDVSGVVIKGAIPPVVDTKIGKYVLVE